MSIAKRVVAIGAVLATIAGAPGFFRGAGAAGAPTCTPTLSAPNNVARSGSTLTYGGSTSEQPTSITGTILRLKPDGTPNQDPRDSVTISASGGHISGSNAVQFADGTTIARLVVTMKTASATVTCTSADLAVDTVSPYIVGFRHIASDQIEVSFDEPVTSAAQQESTWQVDGVPPISVTGTDATRVLHLGQSKGDDATPAVTYQPQVSQSGTYTDIAGNDLAATPGHPFSGTATDAIAPAAPVIDLIDGKAPGSSTHASTTVHVTNVTAGHSIRLYLLDGTTPVPQGAPVTASSSGASFPVTLANGDGQYRFVADATDPHANTTTGAPVTYLLDTTVPIINQVSVANGALQVDFSEEVSGPNLAADWNLSGLSDVVSVSGTGAQRILQTSLPPTAGGTVTYQETTTPYADAAGNPLGQPRTFTIAAVPPVVLSVLPPAAPVAETGAATFHLHLSGPNALPVAVQYQTLDGTAVAGSDYTATSSQVVFTPGQTDQDVVVAVTNDALDEDDETFALEITRAIGVAQDPSGTRTTATIVDDDPLPIATIDDVRLTEPQTGSTTVDLPIKLAVPSGRSVTIPWSTTGGSAASGDDFVASSGSVVYAPGVQTGKITVTVKGDTVGEATEAFQVTLGSPTNASLKRPSGVVTILDADGGLPIGTTTTTQPGSTSTTAPPSQLRIDRLAGADRSATAAALSGATFSTTTDVVIARRDLYPDALAAGPLAASLGAPVLLTASGSLDDATAAEVNRLGATTAHLLGGSGAIGAAVEDDLKARTHVTTITRYAGTDRFDTARLVAEAIGGTDAYVVEGQDASPARGWPDAVSVGALAAHQRRPLLLVTTDAIPPATRLAIDHLGIDRATIVGGTGSVSAAVAKELADAGIALDRIAGSNRYDTSLAVARAAEANGLSGAITWVATGSDWPDALAAGPAAAAAGGVMLLSDRDHLSSAAATWFQERAGQLDDVVLVGGPGALRSSIENEIRGAATPR